MSLPLISSILLSSSAMAQPAPSPHIDIAMPVEAAASDGVTAPRWPVAWQPTAPSIALAVDDVGLAAADQSVLPPVVANAPATEVVPVFPEPPLAQPDQETDGGDLIVQAREQTPADPFENVNAETYQVVAKVDEALVEPVAEVYRDGLPRGLRRAISNFFANLREPVYALNYLLQLKPGKAAETLARFAINSTVGIAGIIDVADDRAIGLPRRRNGFANTLGYYGVGQGPFIVLPLVGATTLRDMIGNGIDQIVSPAALVGRPFTTPYYAVSAFTVSSLDYRIETDEAIEGYRTSDDPYVAMRESYLERRRNEIEALHGRGPLADEAIGGGANNRELAPVQPHAVGTSATPAPAASPAIEADNATPR